IKNNEDIEKCEFIYKKMNEHIPELSKLNFLNSSKTMHNRACNNINESNSCAEDQNPDTVFAAKSYWPQEKWDMNKGTQYIYSKKNKPFCISSSALKDQKYKNLFLAGKNIRVPENIHSSTRVMGVCIATGEKSMINASQFLKEN
ncbi:MAG: FAD-dependent oxidoreductase, partial [Desulfobacteraceae bacterium]|nr:FAD-dependent oxidoreductase [Desulfobacteraceae bacterium]